MVNAGGNFVVRREGKLQGLSIVVSFLSDKNIKKYFGFFVCKCSCSLQIALSTKLLKELRSVKPFKKGEPNNLGSAL